MEILIGKAKIEFIIISLESKLGKVLMLLLDVHSLEMMVKNMQSKFMIKLN